MRFALFGATGPTGRHLIEEALKQGHNLSVYTRDAKKLEAFGRKTIGTPTAIVALPVAPEGRRTHAPSGDGSVLLEIQRGCRPRAGSIEAAHE